MRPFDSLSLPELVRQALSGKGTIGLDKKKARWFYDNLDHKRYSVAASEVYEVVEKGVNHPLRLDLSVIGLEVDEEGNTITCLNELDRVFQDNLSKIDMETNECEILIWIVRNETW